MLDAPLPMSLRARFHHSLLAPTAHNRAIIITRPQGRHQRAWPANQRPVLIRADQWEAGKCLLSEQNNFFVNQRMHKTNQRTIAETLAKQKLHDINMRKQIFFAISHFTHNSFA